MNRSASDIKKIIPVILVVAAISFSNVQRNGCCSPVKLIAEIVTAAGESFGNLANFLGKTDGFLIDDEFFEDERHCFFSKN